MVQVGERPRWGYLAGLRFDGPCVWGLGVKQPGTRVDFGRGAKNSTEFFQGVAPEALTHSPLTKSKLEPGGLGRGGAGFRYCVLPLLSPYPSISSDRSPFL